jgi:hypothetical protein
MTSIQLPQFRCRAAAGRCDITPPVGIYHRMWGAALHDQATGVHRPLTASLLWLEPIDGPDSDARVILSLDHCILETSLQQELAADVAAATGLDPACVLVTLTHTHGSGWMALSRSEFPGGHLIAPYLQDVRQKVRRLAVETAATRQPAAAVIGTGTCSLARHRNFFDPLRGHAVCGLNPSGFSDSTVLVARITAENGQPLATLVNYACHPTTLAWDNTLISPDYVGALRETVEQHAPGICLFLQGASGDLGPREGFTGDTAVADRNGRELAFAVLSTIQSLPCPGTRYAWQEPVLSGTWIGRWAHEPVPPDISQSFNLWKWHHLTVSLPWRHDLPRLDETRRSRDYWLAQETEARSRDDAATIRNCRANVEQMTRQITRLEALAPGPVCPLNVTIGLTGDCLWFFVPGELYQDLQARLRQRFAPRPVFVTTLTGDWQPGYIPPASSYGYGIYQEVIAATAAGCHELLIEELTRQTLTLLTEHSRQH